MPVNIRRQCHVCVSEHLAKIDLLLARGVSCRAIAKRFPEISYQSIWRHSKAHLSPAVRAGLLATGKPQDFDPEALKVAEGESILSNLAGLRGRLLALLATAEEYEDAAQAVACHNALLKNLKLTGQLLHQLGGPITINQNSFLVSTDYLHLRHGILKALQGFPDAKAAVAAAIRAVEKDAHQRRSKGDTEPFREVPVIEHAIQKGSANGS